MVSVLSLCGAQTLTAVMIVRLSVCLCVGILEDHVVHIVERDPLPVETESRGTHAHTHTHTHTL